jgi:hypothetical protein
MQFILSNKIKMFMCLGCMVIYALVFRGFIKYPLMILMAMSQTPIEPVLFSESHWSNKWQGRCFE